MPSLLHDKSFILWCLFPTEESDKQWKENYLSLYPEEAETLMLAREKVCRLKFNHVRLAFAEKTALKKEFWIIARNTVSLNILG